MQATSSNFLPMHQVISANMDAAKAKTETSFTRLALLGIFSGMFIACGSSASNMIMHTIDNVGLARMAGSAIFPVGLMMIVLMGAELFTGDCLMIMGCVYKRYSVLRMLRVLGIVYFSNLIGSVLFAALVSASGQFNYSSSVLGAYTIKVAMGKLDLSFGSAFASGILCNIFVCVAVLTASASKDAAGKIWAIFFPIMAFVVNGFEHCVANMYYIPAAIFAAGNSNCVTRASMAFGYSAEQLEALTWTNFLTRNLIPVTLGNIVGGMLFIGLPLCWIHYLKIKASETA